MKKLLIIPAFVILATTLLAAPPEVKAPKEIPTNPKEWTAVVTDAEKGVNFYPLTSGLQLFPVDKVFPPEMVKGLKTAVVWAEKPGRYELLAWTGNEEGPSKPVIITIVVGNAPTPIPPGPTPPNPNPPEPQPNLTGLALASRIGMTAVQFDGKEATMKQLADNADGIASAVAAGGFDPMPGNAQKALSAWAEGNRKIIGGNTAAFKPWDNALQAEWKKLNSEGKLRTKDQWAQAFRDIATGLR